MTVCGRRTQRKNQGNGLDGGVMKKAIWGWFRESTCMRVIGFRGSAGRPNRISPPVRAHASLGFSIGKAGARI
jgi:hypothetical protein